MKIQSALSVVAIALIAIAAVAAARTALSPHLLTAASRNDAPHRTQVEAEGTFAADAVTSLVDVSASEDGLAQSNATAACHCEQAVLKLEVLLDTQRAALAQLEQTSSELIAAYERAQSGAGPSSPNQDWHDKMIAANRAAYSDLVEVISSLTEEEFPTQITWYGKEWRTLTLPFRVGRYPTAAERDDLLILLEEVGEIGAHHKRLIKQLGELAYDQS